MIFIPLLSVFLDGSISEQTAPTCHNGLSGDYVAQSDDLPNLYFLVLSGYTANAENRMMSYSFRYVLHFSNVSSESQSSASTNIR